jgi:hypothetical protein
MPFSWTTENVSRVAPSCEPWFEDDVIPVKAIFTPDTVRHDNGQVVVEGPAHGDFKGSPIRFTYRFTLEHDAIKALEITA